MKKHACYALLLFLMLFVLVFNKERQRKSLQRQNEARRKTTMFLQNMWLAHRFEWLETLLATIKDEYGHYPVLLQCDAGKVELLPLARTMTAKEKSSEKVDLVISNTSTKDDRWYDPYGLGATEPIVYLSNGSMYVLVSRGHDGKLDMQSLNSISRLFKRNDYGSIGETCRKNSYDPTNGSISTGDIYRLYKH